MILSYRDIFDEDAKRKRIKATITTAHPASSYGEPVIVLDDGRALSLVSWVAMDYQVEKLTVIEKEALQKMGLM